MNPDEPPVDEELKIDRLPFDFQEHDWHKEGYTLICKSCPQVSAHGTNINAGSMLVGKRGEWQLVKEGALTR